MNDEEWRAFRARHLSQHNIFIPDSDRTLYGGREEPPDGPGGSQSVTLPSSPVAPEQAQEEAPSPSRAQTTSLDIMLGRVN